MDIWPYACQITMFQIHKTMDMYTSGTYIMSEYDGPRFKSTNMSVAIVLFQRRHSRILNHEMSYSDII